MNKKIIYIFSLFIVAMCQFQAVFAQSQPGDMVFVGYRMNASGTDDEVAVLTLVDILPGTSINFTDSKYTDNTPTQCPDGLIWTSPAGACVPAGTVITIKTNIPSTSLGTITGSTFGLSSSGDQVIVYTGINTSPTYITALTSNDWASSNTSCGGSLSKKPATLTDGLNSLNMSTAPGNTSGNTVNAYYSGAVTGSVAQLQAAILNPANWIGIGSGTAAQTWPTWFFPGPPAVTGNAVINANTLQIFFSRDLENSSSTNVANFTGVSDLSTITRSNNGVLADTLTLTFSTDFTDNTPLTLTVTNVKDADGYTMSCANAVVFTYTKPNGIPNIADASLNCSVYPTPTNGSLNIKYNLPIDGIFEINDLEGNKVFAYKLPEGNNTAGISVTHLKNGLYTYNLVTPAGNVANGKLVVLK